MNSDNEIKNVIKRIETILELERDISISQLIRSMNMKERIVLIAIGYMLRDEKIYLDEEYSRIAMSFNQFSF
ncbi:MULTISPECIES: winged helix-turn-helix domain-containing protein [Bacteroidales]|uniref:winged helix-turn-helix domain-containing protein n=1 Tax=Bacteroidales TaxID=171549 RepID=UPI001F3CCE70|nr:winged helix-turn-helix domain-containing protein [Parabacteroides distasonis]MCE9040952.1 winged helix-turn-helix domain-containing protein [Parabacteroides distasonis]